MTENKGDLISREALIKWIDDSVSQYGYTYSTDMLNMWGLFKDYLINNAPTVEPDILYLCDHKKCGENFNCYECNHTSDIRHAINFDLMEFPRSVFVERARPQGEWIVEKDVYCRCPFCNFKDVKYSNYCPDCGASLRPKPNQLRDCENCVHHIDGKGCESWECEFEKRSDV